MRREKRGLEEEGETAGGRSCRDITLRCVDIYIFFFLNIIEFVKNF